MPGFTELPGEVLHVMADFVGDDIGHGEIARRLEAPRELAEELRVEIDALVVGAVEWAHRRLRRAAARLVSLGIENQGRRLVAAAEQLLPRILGRPEDLQREALRRRIEGAASGRRADLLRRGR